MKINRLVGTKYGTKHGTKLVQTKSLYQSVPTPKITKLHP